MALDESISEFVSKGFSKNTLRFYNWNPPCVSIGYFQEIESEVDLDYAKKKGIDVIRRLTGGGAVYHKSEITYSLIVSKDILSSDIKKSYEKICSSLVKGLKNIGLNAKFKSINDIIVNGKKISGSAQTRLDNVIIQHGTLILENNIDEMFNVLKVPNEKIKDKMISNVKDRVTSLNSELGFNLGLDSVQKHLVKGFKEVFNVDFIKGKITNKELNKAKKLKHNKYSTNDWIFKR